MDKAEYANYLSAISRAFDEVPLASLPSGVLIMAKDERGQLHRLSPEQAKRENVRVLVARKNLYEGELAKAQEAISVVFANVHVEPVRINGEYNTVVYLQNNQSNRLALSLMSVQKKNAVSFVARALKATMGGYLKVRTLASDNDLILAEKALRILGFDIRGAQESDQILKPKTAKDAEVVDMVFAYQETQPLNVIANKFSMGRVTRLLRVKNDNSKKLVRC